MSIRDVGVRVNVDANTSGASGKLRAFSGVAKGAAAGVAILGAAAVVGGAKLYEIGDRADDANARIRNITEQMGLFGKQASDVSDRLVDYANKQAIANGVDQNTIKATQAKLLTFKQIAGSADQMGGAFDRATLAAVDLAAAGFGSAESNAVQLGKALNDPINGLSALARAGITFTEQEKQRIETLVESNRLGEAQAMVLKAIETQVGGTAASMTGGVDQIKIKMSQLVEEIGLRFVPIVDKAATWLLEKGLPAAQKFAAGLREKLGPAMSAIGGFITDKVIPAAADLYRWFVDKLVPGIRNTVTPILDGLKSMFNKVKDSVSDNSENLNTLREWFTKIVEFVVNKVGPIYGKYLKKQFEIAGTAISVLITFISSLVGWLETAYNKIVDVIDKIGELKDKASGGLGIPGTGLFGAGLALVTGNRAAPRVSATYAPRITVQGGGLYDEAAMVSRMRTALVADLRRAGRPGSTLYRPELGFVS